MEKMESAKGKKNTRNTKNKDWFWLSQPNMYLLYAPSPLCVVRFVFEIG